MSGTKRNGRRSTPNIGKAEALAILASAINYCQRAGLSVKAGNDPKLGLVLAIDGARMKQDAFGVMTFEACPVASKDDASNQAEAEAAITGNLAAEAS